jgi:quercetin dioxygenase-like cupin family protein
MSPTGDAPRRVVTGHDESGRSVVLQDGRAPVSRRASDGATFHELWSTSATPAAIQAGEAEPVTAADPVGPPAGGTRVRLVELPPGTRSPIHRTESVDYGIVLQGRVILVLDDSEVVLGPGDLVVQRGTDHAWENRDGEIARILFVLVDGRFGAELLETLGPDVRSRLMDRM